MSSGEWWPVKIRPIPYELAATETEKAKDATRFHRTNCPCCILAVPETIEGVKNTASAAPPGVRPLPAA